MNEVINSCIKKNVLGKSCFIVSFGLAIIFIFQIAGFREGKKEDLADARIISKHIKEALLSEFGLVDRANEAMIDSLGRYWASKNQFFDNEVANILDRYAHIISDSVVYLMDTSGTVISSSNRNSDNSFVGKNYSFRPYFKNALEGGHGRYIGLGLTVKKVGYYSAFPVIDKNKRTVGIAVIKKGLNFSLIKELDKESIAFLIGKDSYIYASTDQKMEQKLLWPNDLHPKEASILSDKLNSGDEIKLGNETYLVEILPLNFMGLEVVVLSEPIHMIYYRTVAFISGCILAFFVMISIIYYHKVKW